MGNVVWLTLVALACLYVYIHDKETTADQVLVFWHRIALFLTAVWSISRAWDAWVAL